MIVENLERIKVAAFRNAIRLFRDSCVLAAHGSKETAFALAVLAYEEIGKVALADRQLDRVCMNEGSELDAEICFTELSRNHTLKQARAAFDTGNHEFKGVNNLDIEKQSALYTDISSSGIRYPKIEKKRLEMMMREVYRALEEVSEMAYSGVHAETNKKSEWQATRDILSIKEIYEKVISP